MAAPLGNQFAAKAKIWEQALKRAMARSSGTTVDAGLDQLADKVIQAALNGDQWALIEVGNRMDGKPAQIIAGADDLPPVHLKGMIDLVRPS